MALAGSRQEKLWVVIAGGVIGVVLMRFAAAIFIKLLDRFPRFEESAYLLVIVIGIKLVADWGFNSNWGPPSAAGVAHAPHLLDFHDLRRPECIAFWGIMAACFGLGFVPRSRVSSSA